MKPKYTFEEWQEYADADGEDKAISKCHGAPALIRCDDPDSTHWYECSECGDPCDITF